ncbi:MAG: PQQ-like beta-propeller repeat protein [Blastocatellia bacterium]|nr:PQQ-like beta-propeller repeat protein [Blastocatellia bacterium]
MKQKQIFIFLIVMVLTSTVAGGPAVPSDWPQWRGVDRTGISKETGLLKQWPDGGPAVVWSVSDLGEGYGSVAVKGNRVFVQGVREGQSAVFCLNRADGKPVWATALGRSLDQDRGGGPRGTPTVEGDRVYVLAENGELACLKAADGSALWRRNILNDFGGRNPRWLISESPLIDGNRLVVTPGGSGAAIVALDKMTGKNIWSSRELSDRAGYSSCQAVDVGGVRTILGFTDRAAVGVRASDGKLMWRYEQVANRTANITTPIFHNNKVFYTSAYGTGCALLDLKAQDGEVKAEEVYFNREMMNHHGGVVLVDGYLYGFSNAILVCIEFATGKLMWKDRSVGKGAVVYADGHLYLLSENQVVGLAEATPAGYKEKGRFNIADKGWPSWAHPVVSGGCLFIRNQGMLTCYSIKAGNA